MIIQNPTKTTFQTIKPRSIYIFPWSMDYGQADLLPIILHYLWEEKPSTLLTTIHAPHTLQSPLPCLFPKFLALSPKTVSWALYSPTNIDLQP